MSHTTLHNKLKMQYLGKFHTLSLIPDDKKAVQNLAGLLTRSHLIPPSRKTQWHSFESNVE